MSYSRPDESWGYEPPEPARPTDGPAWGGQEPPAEPPRPGRRRSMRSRRSARASDEPAPEPAPRTGEHEADPDHTMPPPSPHLLHRLPPLAATVVISAGLILGAQLERPAYAVGIAVLQLAMLLCVTWTRRIDGTWVTLAVGAGLAIAADWAAVAWTPVSLMPITVLLAGAFVATAAAQLVRHEHAGVIESVGFTMLLCVAVTGYASYIALSRLGAAPPAMYSAVVAAGTAILAARAVDLVMPDPRINRQVTRGAFGVVIGTMCGTASAAYAGLVIEGPEPRNAAIGGLLIALTAVLVDLACGYMAAARRIDGEGTAPHPVTDVAGPLLAFAITGPVVYLLSAYYIID
ncbi:hypothetical protein L0U85_00440 [Glycomyces sp. L485]|uniref:hypothetical protein n=1 Tax=Glycomyces sp. L485 TaxID=2909235 RepID=UPI001F4BBC90|nr:hypothetical protein [Glycomyces sp. L485]MCH7229339.1 hypothetical protein [Glycomyces sp. L485]